MKAFGCCFLSLVDLINEFIQNLKMISQSLIQLFKYNETSFKFRIFLPFPFLIIKKCFKNQK